MLGLKALSTTQSRQIQLHINIAEYTHDNALPIADKQLLFRAREAAEESYAPYSNFKVGAAILLANGDIVTGSNQENAAFSMCMCAERAALAAASYLYPNVAPIAMAITARAYNSVLQVPVPPCGACRQVIAETESRFRKSVRILMQGEIGVIWKVDSIKEILPLTFNASFL